MGLFKLWLEEDTYRDRLHRAYRRYLKWYQSEKQKGVTPDRATFRSMMKQFAGESDVSLRDLMGKARDHREERKPPSEPIEPLTTPRETEPEEKQQSLFNVKNPGPQKLKSFERF